jgi:ubiquinone/menaquinone biosynthesis C-methylase UbiE
MISKSEKYFRRLLKISPLSVAIWRAVEAKFLSKEKLISPVLDLGCGFGEFMQAFADNKIDVGLDVNRKDLIVAEKSNKYKKVILADARKMPFPDNSFKTIVSISTVEHIKNPSKLLKECYRVLKPGGKFILSIETDRVDENTFYRPLLSKIGLKPVSKFLTEKYNSFFKRQVLLNNEDWIKLFKNQKFKIEKLENIISPNVTKIYDLFILTAWPSQILKAITGKRIVFRPKFIEDFLVKFFLKYVDEVNDGTNIFLIAKK